MKKLSVVIPFANEEANVFFWDNLTILLANPFCETILVGYAQDKTFEQIQKNEYNYFPLNTSSRSLKIDLGVRMASCQRVLIIHPRSRVSREGIAFLLNSACVPRWGGLTHQFDDDHIFFRFTSWYSNRIRAKFRGIIYLDHCIFFDKADYTPIGNRPIFEDTFLSLALKKNCFPVVIPFGVVTSSIRFRKNGILKQSILNQLMKLGLYLGFSLEALNTFYEKGLELNTGFRRKM